MPLPGPTMAIAAGGTGKHAAPRTCDESVLAPLYRGQLSRADAWRQRLDTTTNWAVVLTAALLTWIFSSREHPHYVLLVGIVGVTAFLIIEARRYRQYDVWRYRVRMLEEHFFAARLVGPDDDGGDWRRLLSDDLRQPEAKIPFREAFVRRLRRTHFALIGVLLLAWILKVVVFAPEAGSLFAAMAIEAIPGAVVGFGVGVYVAAVLLLAVLPMKRHAKGEIDDMGDFDRKDD